MAVSASRVAFATAASLAAHWLLTDNSSVLELHPALPLVLPAAIFLLLLLLTVVKKNKSGGNEPPGPAAFPVFGNWLQVGNDLNHRFLARLSARYGPVFRLRLGVRNLVVVSDPSLAAEVLHTQGVEFGSRPRNLVFDIFTANGADMVFTEYGEHWRRMRRVMTPPFFTQRVVQQYGAAWEAEMDAVVADLRSDAAAAGVVVRRRLQLMLYNIMYRMMFDARFESVDDPLFVGATKFNSERSRLAQSFDYNYGDFIPALRPFLRGYLRRCRDLQTRRLAFFNDNYVQKRRQLLQQQTSSSRDTLRCAMDHVLDAERRGEITAENVIYIVENINVAAIETTLWSIEWALAEVVNHPAVQRRLRDEIAATLADDEPLTEANVHRLAYLQAVVKETLRLHSPIPLLVPHMNLDDATLGGFAVPRGSKVVVNAWWLANNPDLWDRPDEFRPDRFLAEDKAVDATVGGGKVDFRFLPFGVGRRSCPGIILALPILALVVGKLVRSFEMLPPPGVDKLDVTEKGGQFSLHIANHSVIAFHPVSSSA